MLFWSHNIDHLHLKNILLNKRSYENILTYYVANKTSYSEKPLHIIFGEVDGYLRKYDRTKYLTLFPPDGKYGIMFERIKYHISQESNNSDGYYHMFINTWKLKLIQIIIKLKSREVSC